jgi:hypothetical protein
MARPKPLYRLAIVRPAAACSWLPTHARKPGAEIVLIVHRANSKTEMQKFLHQDRIPFTKAGDRLLVFDWRNRVVHKSFVQPTTTGTTTGRRHGKP